MVELNEQQKQKVKEWVKEGLTLSDIQKKLREEFNISVTFLDLRFMVLDLGLAVSDKQSANAVELNKNGTTQKSAQEVIADEADSKGIAGKVTVELDRVVKAGAIVSGNVTFSDGVSCAWSLDQFGRLALSASQPGYRPSQSDLEEFQTELTRMLERRGF
jgi:hypothetical protein